MVVVGGWARLLGAQSPLQVTRDPRASSFPGGPEELGGAVGGAAGAPGHGGGAQGWEGAGSPASTCLRLAFSLLSSWRSPSVSMAAIQLSRTLVSWKRVSFRWKEALASISWPRCSAISRERLRVCCAEAGSPREAGSLLSSSKRCLSSCSTSPAATPSDARAASAAPAASASAAESPSPAGRSHPAQLPLPQHRLATPGLGAWAGRVLGPGERLRPPPQVPRAEGAASVLRTPARACACACVHVRVCMCVCMCVCVALGGMKRASQIIARDHLQD